MGNRILVADDSPINLSLVQAALEPDYYDIKTANDGKEALTVAAEFKPELVILDVMMPEMDGYQACAELRRNPSMAQTPVLMLTARSTLEEKIRGFESGADDYMTKPFEPAELRVRVSALLKRAVPPPEPAAPAAAPAVSLAARRIAVFSLRGGSGVTTFAANLAVALRRLWDEPVCLVDMAMTAGQAAVMLNAPLRRTWSGLTERPVAELDWDVLSGHLLTHTSGTKVLAAPLRSAEGEEVTLELVKAVFDQLADRLAYLVFDCPHDFRDTTLAALDFADKVVLLAPPEITGVRAAAMALDTFESLGYDDAKVDIVINWTFPKRGLARKDIEDALHRRIRLVMPYDDERFAVALNSGTPVVEADAAAPVAALLEDYAYRLSKPEHLQAPFPNSPSAALQHVAARLKAARAAKEK